MNENQATYSPEDNKLRLYVGRVPRDEYLKLRAEGWTSTPKQSCDFVATWTPERRDTALEYAGIIEDEDQGPAERAADRAERFGGYREKRTDEATGRADSYDAGPQVHGYQSQARAERSAARHDRIAARACDAWSKAEYWQRRTAGVISHALYKALPGVRMGRIKELEAHIRKAEKSRAEYAACFERWTACAAMTDAEAQNTLALTLAYVEHGNYTHPRTGRKSYLYDLAKPDDGRNDDPLTGAELCALWLSRHKPLAEEGDWLTHYRLRLAYENQMMEAEGGRASLVEMEVGGWIGGKQIRKVVRSSVTGQVTSVEVLAKFRTHEAGKLVEKFGPILVNVERTTADVYTPPTPEDVAAMEKIKADEKAARPKVATIPLVNPTDADAERLQAILNRQNASALASWHRNEPAPTVARITQAQYSAASKGSYGRCETIELTGGGRQRESGGCMRQSDCPTVAKVRTWGYRVVILSDKPQKPFPANVWHDPRPALIAELAKDFAALEQAVKLSWLPERDTDARRLLDRAELVRIVYISSMSQFGFTDSGHKWATEQRAKLVTVNA